MSRNSLAVLHAVSQTPEFVEAIRELAELEAGLTAEAMQNALQANQIHTAHAMLGALRAYQDMPSTIAKYAAMYDVTRF